MKQRRDLQKNIQMLEFDNFKKIFNYTPVESPVEIKLEETGNRAKIRHLNIKGGGVNLVSFEEKYSDKVGQLFIKASHCKKNADGIIAFENTKGKNLLLCEMKSSGGGVFDSAFQQVFSSYMKMCMLLSLCDNFDISQFNIFFLFTSREDVDLAQKQNELEQIDAPLRSYVDNIRLTLLMGKRVKFKLCNVPHDMSFLHKDFTNKEVVCMLLTSATDTIDVDINTIL